MENIFEDEAIRLVKSTSKYDHSLLVRLRIYPFIRGDFFALTIRATVTFFSEADAVAPRSTSYIKYDLNLISRKLPKIVNNDAFTLSTIS